MCGIVGYTGKRQAKDILLDGIKRLEYRGYDSAGIALLTGDGLMVSKSVGKIVELEKVLGDREFESNTVLLTPAGPLMGNLQRSTHTRTPTTAMRSLLCTTESLRIIVRSKNSSPARVSRFGPRPTRRFSFS